MIRRSPALPALQHGTMTVMSLWRILSVRYSRSSPNIVRISFFSTRPGAVMRVDDAVADLELDVLGLDRVELRQQLLFFGDIRNR